MSFSFEEFQDRYSRGEVDVESVCKRWEEAIDKRITIEMENVNAESKMPEYLDFPAPRDNPKGDSRLHGWFDGKVIETLNQKYVEAGWKGVENMKGNFIRLHSKL